jgi:hypothetical protein
MSSPGGSGRARAAQTRFFDVDGVPVKIEPAADGGLDVFAFDPEPRFFPLHWVLRAGAPITPGEFAEMVRECAIAKRPEQGRAREVVERTKPRDSVEDENSEAQVPSQSPGGGEDPGKRLTPRTYDD